MTLYNNVHIVVSFLKWNQVAHSHTHSHTHTYTQHTNISRTCTFLHTHTHTHIHTYTHTHIHTHTNTTHTHTHTLTHTYTHIHTHNYTHAQRINLTRTCTYLGIHARCKTTGLWQSQAWSRKDWEITAGVQRYYGRVAWMSEAVALLGNHLQVGSGFGICEWLSGKREEPAVAVLWSRLLVGNIHIRYFWQGNHQIYGHIWCKHAIVANSTDVHILHCHLRAKACHFYSTLYVYLAVPLTSNPSLPCAY